MKEKKYILAIDQGTTSSRAIIFDKKGKIVAKSQKDFGQLYPSPGWVEHSPRDILASVMGVVAEVLALSNLTGANINSIGITNQRETVVVWDRATGEPIYNAIVWQCRRSSDICEKIKKDGLEPLIYKKTGLVLDAYFSASKIKWILDNVEGARVRAENGELCAGTIDAFLLFHLTGGKEFKTDYTNASRTMLFNIETLSYDDELLKIFGVPKAMLAEVCPSGHMFGETAEGILGKKIPITGMAGDQQAALFGHLCTENGMAKNTYGTGCFLLMNTGEKRVVSSRGLISTLAAGLDNKPNYVLEGSVFVGGAVVQWLRDEMRLIKSAADTEMYANRVSDTNGVYVVPAFVGLGAPHWLPDARGIITGLTRGTTKEHVIRAALEGIAYQVFDILHAMERDTGLEFPYLSVDGGASANNFLMQFQSDIIGKKVIRPVVLETTALGACYLAGLYTGYYSSVEDIRKNVATEKEFSPSIEKEKRDSLIMGWETAVLRTKIR